MIRAVVTDLDNTLYDWVNYYVESFDAMVSELSRISGVSSDDLRASFKRVHQRHDSTEYAFSIQELDVLPSADRALPLGELLVKYEPAITAFRDTRRRTLRLYPGVEDGLHRIKERGILLIAHTDAMRYYAVARLRQLGVIELFDGLVASRDHGLPEGYEATPVAPLSEQIYHNPIPFTEELDLGLRKPDPRCLVIPLRHFGIPPEHALYVGDSLVKDVYMAQQAGVRDVLAEYGHTYDSMAYERLVEITHWTSEAVERETKLRRQRITPSWRISSFCEVLDILDEAGVDRPADARAVP